VRAKILILEDDPELQELYAMMLEGLDCELMLAFNGQEALEKLAELRPDLVILDILMSKVMGNEVHTWMRQDPRYAETPVIVVSVLSADRCQDMMSMDERTRFLRKPFQPQELLEAVREALPDEVQEV
jgi:CheY-like chemotaxis protein